MRNRDMLSIIQKNFTDKKEFIGDGYYRFRSLEDDTFELAFLIGGPCGETIVHPKIVVKVNGEEVIGESLIDLYTTPTKIFTREESSSEIDQALYQLLKKFLVSKHLADNI